MSGYGPGLPATLAAPMMKDPHRDTAPLSATAAAAGPSLKHRMMEALSEDTFARHPLRALWMLPPLASIVLGTLAIVRWELAWYWALPLALVMGNSYAMMGLLAHEVLHGATVKARWLQTALGYVGFGPSLISPNLWRHWHNAVHHGKTNQGNRDPDSFGTLWRYTHQPITRLVVRLAPGSRHWYSYLFLFYWFPFHGQIVLWIHTKHMKAFKRFSATRSKIETFAFLGLWVALGVWAGWRNSLFVIVIPMAIGNFIAMSYIATNHFLRPQAANYDPIDNSMGVTTPLLLDWLHFRFSHHVEHHYFPAMSGGQLPRVRAWLLANVRERYVAPPHWKAVQYLYRTPRVYRDPDTLCDPNHLTRTVNIADVTRALQAASAI